MTTTLIVCIKRRADLSPAQFSHHWREVHAPLLLACTPFSRHILRYEQFRMADRNDGVAALFGAAGGYDGVAAITFADAQSIAAAFQEEAYLSQVRPDEPNFIDLDNCLSFIGDGLCVKGS